MATDAALFVGGVDIWPMLERLRAAVMHPVRWAADATLAADLCRFADVLETAPAPPLRTKPTAVARQQFARDILATLARYPQAVENVTDRRALARGIMEAFGVKPPKSL